MATRFIKKRRTQAERSSAMQRRILDATLKCLAADGYAGTTVSRITQTAGVSRGAPMHHFENKAALMKATAEMMIKRVYLQMGKAMEELEASDDRLHDLIYSAWKHVFYQPEFRALQELLMASQRDKDLAFVLQQVWTAGHITLGNAADHYLEPIHENANVRQAMTLTQWLLRGMALDLHLVESPDVMDHYLKLWSQMLALHLRAKPKNTASTSEQFFTK